MWHTMRQLFSDLCIDLCVTLCLLIAIFVGLSYKGDHKSAASETVFATHFFYPDTFSRGLLRELFQILLKSNFL